MNRQEKVTAALWLKAVAAQAEREYKNLSAELAAEAKAEYDKDGTRVSWDLRDIGAVRASVSHTAITVTDPRALLEWVQLRHPTEVVATPQIRNSFLGILLSDSVPAGEVACDPETGEVIPGLGVRKGGQFMGVSITGATDAKRMLSAVASRGLRELAASHGPNAPVVLAELGSGDA